MKHCKQGRKFSRKKGVRRAFLKSLAHDLILHEKMVTTEARAKELKSYIERLTAYGIKKNLAGRRLLLQELPKDAATKMYEVIAPRYAERRGGYVKTVKLASKRRDAAPMAKIEFT